MIFAGTEIRELTCHSPRTIFSNMVKIQVDIITITKILQSVLCTHPYCYAIWIGVVHWCIIRRQFCACNIIFYMLLSALLQNSTYINGQYRNTGFQIVSEVIKLAYSNIPNTLVVHIATVCFSVQTSMRHIIAFHHCQYLFSADKFFSEGTSGLFTATSQETCCTLPIGSHT